MLTSQQCTEILAALVALCLQSGRFIRHSACFLNSKQVGRTQSPCLQMSSIPVGAASLEVTFVARKDGYEDAGVASFIQRNPSICIGYFFRVQRKASKLSCYQIFRGLFWGTPRHTVSWRPAEVALQPRPSCSDSWNACRCISTKFRATGIDGHGPHGNSHM